MQGINQIQVRSQIGLTFASLLRSILRQDPDVIMVGEIRDGETAQIAVQAALTGHLVLSTLHTNSAAAAVTRLRDMGVEDYLLTAVLRGIMAQRLVRRLCPDCRRAGTGAAGTGRTVSVWIAGHTARPIMLSHAVGCPACRQTGYRGRAAIAEFLELGPEIERLIFARADHATHRTRRRRRRAWSRCSTPASPPRWPAKRRSRRSRAASEPMHDDVPLHRDRRRRRAARRA